jgi:hypothetical protein
MTTAPERRPRAALAKPRRALSPRSSVAEQPAYHPKPRAGRTGGERPWSLWTWGDLCGCCSGRLEIWCDGCCGFGGCYLCGGTEKRPCPVCVGGSAEPVRW